MQIEPEFKRKLILHLIDKVFLPKLTNSLQSFLSEYEKMLQFKIEWKIMTGFEPIIEGKVVTMNIRKETEELVNNLMVTFDKLK